MLHFSHVEYMVIVSSFDLVLIDLVLFLWWTYWMTLCRKGWKSMTWVPRAERCSPRVYKEEDEDKCVKRKFDWASHTENEQNICEPSQQRGKAKMYIYCSSRKTESRDLCLVFAIFSNIGKNNSTLLRVYYLHKLQAYMWWREVYIGRLHWLFGLGRLNQVTLSWAWARSISHIALFPSSI